MSWLVLVLSGVLEAVWAAALGRSSAMTRSVESGPTQPPASTTTTPKSPCARRQTAAVASNLFESIHPDAIETEPTRPTEIGMRRVAFSVDDIDEAIEIAARHDCDPLRAMGTYGDMYKLTYVRGLSGIIVTLAEELKS